jgi:hypothetical protein
MKAPASRFADGLLHRVICSVSILLAMGGMTLLRESQGTLTQLCWLGATLLGATLAFLAPLILTGGFNKPFPSSQHLALISRRTQRALGFAVIALLLLPTVIRLIPRM